MWIWWIISLVVLIACFIFAYKVIVSSYDLLPVDKKNFLSFKKPTSLEAPPSRPEAIWDIKHKLQKVEENSSFYEIQFTKLQERLKALESQYKDQGQNFVSQQTDEEDWKELYYEENEVKVKLENELDLTRQKLEEVENQLQDFDQNHSSLNSLQSDYDARLKDIQSMQDNVSVLHRQLEAAAGREKELELALAAEINAKKQYSNLESENARLRSENDDLRKQIVDLSKKEKELDAGISRLRELESQVAIYEEEKARMIAGLESMVNQNKMVTAGRSSR